MPLGLVQTQTMLISHTTQSDVAIPLESHNSDCECIVDLTHNIALNWGGMGAYGQDKLNIEIKCPLPTLDSEWGTKRRVNYRKRVVHSD